MLTTNLLCKWPIKFLEDKLYGICSGDLITIACDSGVGKSTLSRLITRSARDQHCPVVLYSLENRPDTFVTEEVLREYEEDTGEHLDMRQFEILHTNHPERFVKYRQRVFEKDSEVIKRGEEDMDVLVVHEQVTKGDWNVYNLIKSMKVEILKGYRLFIIDHLDVLVQKDELSDTKMAMDELWSLVQEHNIAIVAFSQIVKKCIALCPSYDDLRGHKAKVYMPPEHPQVSKLLKVYTDCTGLEPTPKSIGGGTYAKMIPNVLAFGPIFPGDEVREHKPDEFMELSRLKDNANILAEAMYAMAND